MPLRGCGCREYIQTRNDVQRAVKDREQKQYTMPIKIHNVAESLQLLKSGNIL